MATTRNNTKLHVSVTAGQSKAKNVSQLVKKVTSTKAATSSIKKPPMEHQKQSKESDPDNEGEWHQVPIKSPRPATPSQLERQVSFISVNPFSVLNNDEEDESLRTRQLTEEQKPPPIYVKSVTNVKLLCDELVKVAGNKFSIKAGINNLSVMPSDSDSYRKINKYLKERNAEYHSYQLPEDRPLRVVIRNLHHTLGCDVIKAELEELGFRVLGVHNVYHRKSKAPLPIFFVDLEKTEKSTQIFAVKYLYYTSIIVEEPRLRNEIPQCKRCQAYGHTRTYCNLNPRCVKCAGSHLSSICKKSKETPPKCALCDEAHPANYRGCSVHKELKKLRQKPPFRNKDFYEERNNKPKTGKDSSPEFKKLDEANTLELPPQVLPDLQTHVPHTLI